MQGNDSSGVAAKAFHKIEGHWKSCCMTEYEEPTNRYLVKWDDTKVEEWLPRIHILFLSEDPFLFVERVNAAVQSRKEAESMMVCCSRVIV